MISSAIYKTPQSKGFLWEMISHRKHTLALGSSYSGKFMEKDIHETLNKKVTDPNGKKLSIL